MRPIQHNLRKFCGYLFKMQWIRLNKTVDCSAEFTGFHYIFAEIRRLWSTVNVGEQYIMNVCRSCAEVVMGMDTVDFSGSVNIQWTWLYVKPIHWSPLDAPWKSSGAQWRGPALPVWAYYWTWDPGLLLEPPFSPESLPTMTMSTDTVGFPCIIVDISGKGKRRLKIYRCACPFCRFNNNILCPPCSTWPRDVCAVHLFCCR
jgi:hypothetical protein